jgi:2,3-bisphosphoglycerate-independent phosphoglycerate mutase
VRAALLILDGAGLAAAGDGNAVTERTMPTLFGMMSEHGFATLEASGPPVGLGEGEVGNSEVGHLTIGAGYVVPSTLARIDGAYRDGSWQGHHLWQKLAFLTRLHVVGLLSDAGVHGHWRSLAQAAELASRRGIRDVVVHPVLDGVDSQAGTAPDLLKKLVSELAAIGPARVGVVMGRKWFCDRSGNLELTKVFVDALCDGPPLPEFGEDELQDHVAKASEASFAAHLNPGGARLRAGEAVLITQHRADRAAQVARLLTQTATVYTLVELDPAVPVANVFFPTTPLSRGLGFEFKNRNLRSVRIAESCKFPHVTYFLNGLNKDLEGRPVCINSIPEAAIAENPRMSLDGVMSETESALQTPENRVVIANLANLDQVGHLGNFALAAQAAHHVDQALARILTVAREGGWNILVTSDHGNADCVTDQAGRPFGSHTGRPVPFTAVPSSGTFLRWRDRNGSLANIAPSLLAVLGEPIPAYMSSSLLERAQ